ncbi:MAG: DUF6444 domain-containing protein [Actinomycetota bacterium]|nr:DUF6444 domain-containing protein [Actinomycetota bacterium]
MQLKREEAERVALAGGEPARELMLSLFDRVADQGEQLEKLERRLGQSSRNSSRAPSTDRPDQQGAEKPKRPRKRSEREQGAQPGHRGAGRELVEDPDETIPVRPDCCRKCGRRLCADGDGRVAGRPVRHQVIELPETVVLTTEHRLLKVS